jgi:DNA-binding response OmpR family regulator
MDVFAAAEGHTLVVVGETALRTPDAAMGSALAATSTERKRALVVMRPSPEADVIDQALATDGLEVMHAAVPAEGEVATAEAAVERVRSLTPDIVILDGDADGIAACRAMRALGGAGERAAIILVGPTSVPGSETGASGWLESPLSVEYARARCRAWLLRMEARWQSAPRPQSEAERLAALHRLALLDSAPEERFDRLARLAAGLLEAPVSLVTLIDRDRQWFKSRVGTPLTETTRDVSFCAHAILGDGSMVVQDALEDERFADNPIVAGPPHVRFYAGYPLTLPDGHAMGALCVMDTRPRRLSENQLSLLRDLADLVEEELARLHEART